MLHPRPIIPFMVAATGIATFSLMDAAMKDLVLAIGAFNAVMWRNMTGAALGGAVFVAGRNAWPARDVVRLHLWRSFVVSFMALSFFWSLGHLPLAEAIGLSFIAPVIALYLAAVLLGEKIGKEAIVAAVAGMIGVAIIMVGKFSGEYTRDAVWGAAAVLFSAVLYAYNLILARKQAQAAGPVEIVFFQNLFVAVFLCFAAPWFLEPVPVGKMPMVLASAGLAMISLFFLSWANARAEAQILIPVEYTAFIWAAIVGWIVFHEAVTIPTALGTALIIAGSVVAARAKPSEPQHIENTAL